MLLFINYCFDILQPHFLANFREIVSFSMCAAYVSTYLVEAHI